MQDIELFIACCIDVILYTILNESHKAVHLY